eukprot:CAMPEP_0177578528 /NCGR_PEP_ID=MMETSP0419_2-20121207/398_1 /TAXON_ID=582737 /ORGANISM="Tetraselmis sp., Strain GSL018" /LENGTH=319 /DNA_ID=CAMNT_0019066981 /DNA_START=393 /DNA_END=1352 /DNA_ORIENTATION=-
MGTVSGQKKSAASIHQEPETHQMSHQALSISERGPRPPDPPGVSRRFRRTSSTVERAVKQLRSLPSHVGFLFRLKQLHKQQHESTGHEAPCQSHPGSNVISSGLRERQEIGIRVDSLSQEEIIGQRRADRVARERREEVPERLRAVISKAELDILQQLFEHADTDGSGCIGLGELPQMLRVLGLNPIEFTVSQLLKDFDVTRDGELNFGEFVSLWYAYREEGVTEDTSLEIAFSVFDRDESGAIDIEEFCTAMSEMGDLLSRDEIEHFFQLVDPDRTGRLTRQAFMESCGSKAAYAKSRFAYKDGGNRLACAPPSQDAS